MLSSKRCFFLLAYSRDHAAPHNDGFLVQGSAEEACDGRHRRASRHQEAISWLVDLCLTREESPGLFELTTKSDFHDSTRKENRGSAASSGANTTNEIMRGEEEFLLAMFACYHTQS